jgi:DNA topoisomerase-1
MPTNFFIIEAPGKRRSMLEALRRTGIRNIEIEATLGHLAANPAGLKPVAVNSQYCETAYRLMPDKEHLAARIAAKAADARRIYLATDDDQEGDVIARDVMRFCIPAEYRYKAVRLRLRALAQSEIKAALLNAQPFDEAMAAKGDARRIIDRLIGSLSSPAGAVGRVQSSLLLALTDQRPVIGVVTHALSAADGKGDFVARVPVFAGQPVPPTIQFDQGVLVDVSYPAKMSQGPWNHDQILFSVSMGTGATIDAVSRSMQALYENGRMSYPRAKDKAITPESARRLALIGRANGATFRPELFTSVRSTAGEHAHEAPNPTVLDVPVNRALHLLPIEEQVLALLTRNLIDHGIEGRLDRPQVKTLPESLRNLHWTRLTPVGTRLWPQEAVKAGFLSWTPEQSLLHFMMRNDLGRPSTIIKHINKFLTNGLSDQRFDLTKKGCDYADNIVTLIGHRNLSSMIESYIEKSKNSSSQIVNDMIELFNLDSVKTVLEQEPRLESLHDEHDEIYAGHLS